ncbi:MAG: hypothetical protein GX556_09575 [Fibrobacter sp.]|nr:hypothetical protein [Fibrobacter sp.]
MNKPQGHLTGGTSAICESLYAQGTSAIRPDPGAYVRYYKAGLSPGFAGGTVRRHYER